MVVCSCVSVWFIVDVFRFSWCVVLVMLFFDSSVLSVVMRFRLMFFMWIGYVIVRCDMVFDVMMDCIWCVWCLLWCLFIVGV